MIVVVVVVRVRGRGFRFGVRLVSSNLFPSLACFLDVGLPDLFRAHAERRQQSLEVTRVAGRAFGLIRASNQRFELFPAAEAPEFVERHGRFRIR